MYYVVKVVIIIIVSSFFARRCLSQVRTLINMWCQIIKKQKFLLEKNAFNPKKKQLENALKIFSGGEKTPSNCRKEI